MSRSAYGKRKCYVCGRYISTAGFAWTNHSRKHVREGLLVEKEMWNPQYSWIKFTRTDKPLPDKYAEALKTD